jgi:hypothetical protein
MNIEIDASSLSGQRTGVGEYSDYPVKYWSAKLDPNGEMQAYLREAFEFESLYRMRGQPVVQDTRIEFLAAYAFYFLFVDAENSRDLARKRGSAITWQGTTCQTLDVIWNVASNGLC